MNAILNAPAVAIVRTAKTPSRCPYAQARWQGYEDVRQGRGFAPGYDGLTRKEQYAYERGRLQATMARVARPDAGLPAWPRNAHIRPLLARHLGWQAAATLFAETALGRSQAVR